MFGGEKLEAGYGWDAKETALANAMDVVLCDVCALSVLQLFSRKCGAAVAAVVEAAAESVSVHIRLPEIVT